MSSENSPWRVAPPDAVGFAADLADRLDAGLRSGLLRDLHAVLVARGDALVLERYDAGEDEAWGRAIGRVDHGVDTLHDLRSITKSVVSLLYGIALDRGLVATPDAPLLGAFPELADLAADPARGRLTIEHALTMTLGLEWDETKPYTDPKNSEIAMETAADRTRYIASRPVVAEAGTRWTYSGGAAALVGAIIERGVGAPLSEFAREALFEPLGVERFEWSRGRDGAVSSASGLRLAARDLLRIGRMALAGGVWRDRRVVSQAWLDAAFTKAIEVDPWIDYGRFWWLSTAPSPAAEAPVRWVAGFGNGGQRLFIAPSLDLAAVIYAGRYNQPDDWVGPTRVWREIVLATLQR